MEQENKNLMGPLLVILTGSIIFIFFHWAAYTQIYVPEGKTMLAFTLKIINPDVKMIYVRIIYYAMLWCLFLLYPSIKIGRTLDDKQKKIYLISSFSLFILFLVGYIDFFIWDVIIYPMIIIITIPITVRAAAALRKRIKEETFFGGASCEPAEKNFFFEFNTTEGLLRVHKPEENIFIDGGPGSGKSHYLIKFMIQQAAQRQYAGIIYDYEGDPTKDGCPILSNIAFSSVLNYAKSTPNYNLKFAFINFTDMTRTVRVNILSTKYYRPESAQLFIDNVATCLMKNLEPSWKEKTDFWAGNAINYVSSVMYMLYKNYSKEGYNTLPHAVSVCLSDSDTVFRFLESDPEIAKTMSPMISAWKLGASQQTAGAVSSAQLPLRLIYKKEIYWVLGKDEFSLDITNKDNPVLLCIGNSPELKDSISPAISSIFTVVQSQMNNSGKAPSIFCIDELPTINLYGLDRFIATARKHFVSTILAAQDYMQLVRDYGDKSASTVRASCGSRFQGKTGNNKTCEEIAKLLGDMKKTNLSYSDQSSGGHSVTESLQREKVLQERDIASQESGHFFGIISNGRPPFIYTDFEPFHKVPMQLSSIPAFACKYKSGNDETDRNIQYSLVSENFKKIESDVTLLLSSFIAASDE